MGALEPARARGDLADRDGGGVVDEERAGFERLGGVDEAAELVLVHVAAADLVRGDFRGLGEDAAGKLFGRHLEREEPHDAAIHRALRAVGQGALAIGPGDVEGDVGGERRLAHRGPPGEDQQVGAVQPAELAVHVVERGGEPGQPALAHMGGVGHVHGILDRRRKLWKPLSDLPCSASW